MSGGYHWMGYKPTNTTEGIALYHVFLIIITSYYWLMVDLPLWKKKMMSSSVGMMTFPVFLGSHKIPWFQSPPNSITFRDFDGTFVDSWPHGNLGADSQIVPRSVDQEIKFPCEVQWIYRWESPNWNVVVVVVVVVVVDLVRGFTHWKWWIFHSYVSFP